MALHIITGPPGAGKTFFVAERAQPGDVRIDLDHLANHFAGLPLDGHDHDSRVWAVAKAARTAAIDAALKHSDTLDVWIIDSSPTDKNLQRYHQHGAQVHVIDPGKSVVMSRCKAERPPETLKVAGMWYSSQAKAKPLAIKSFAFGRQHPRGLVLDARGLPNPHEVPALRVPDGTSRRVGEWMSGHADVADFIREAINRIDREVPHEVWVGCSAGKHRSVYVAQELAEHYGTVAEHTALAVKKPTSTTERGYGWEHQREREKKLRRHRDGTPCWWCGLPMYGTRNKKMNWDGKGLAADHENERGAAKGELASRLLHCDCNSQRKGGQWDDVRPAILGVHPADWSVELTRAEDEPVPGAAQVDFGGIRFD